MTTKLRKRTVYITVVTDIVLTFIASIIFGGGLSTIIQIMCIATLVLTFLGTIIPLFDKFWDAIANFFYLLAFSLPAVVIIFGSIGIFQLMNTCQKITIANITDFIAIIAYGCFGIAVILLGRTHRAYPFWYKTKKNDTKLTKNKIGWQKIEGFKSLMSSDNNYR
ncbi:MAG: hypothetical protein EOM85_01830 [Candidatus Moranbacteria bacterium]|nr:hypothetical protein [Candidatus Moranbacteria bacterium]